MTPHTQALTDDMLADIAVRRAQRSMDTDRISEAIARRRDTTHALMAVQLRQARQERENARSRGLAAD